MSDLIQDVQLAVHGFWKAPVFTIGAVLTLTLAIGANTAIFSLLNALVLRDLPVREPSSLVSLTRATPTTAEGAFSLPDVPRGVRAAAEPVSAHRLDLEQRHQRRNRRCPDPRQCFGGHGELLHRARDSAGCRAATHRYRRQRRHTALGAGRGHRARVLAATLQSQSGCGRPHPSGRGHALHDRRGSAGRLHWPRADARDRRHGAADVRPGRA